MPSERPDMDATGIEVTLNEHHKRGATRWVIPLGGGVIRQEGFTIEIHPQVELSRNRWRTYDEVEQLAATVEKSGGYIYSGDTIHVGDEILAGRDAMELLTHLNRRANDRHTRDEATYEQGYADAVRDMKTAVSKLDPRRTT